MLDVSSVKARTESVSLTTESPGPRTRPGSKEEVEHTVVERGNLGTRKRPFPGGCT